MAEKVRICTASTDGIEMDYFTFGCGRRPFVILPGLSLKSVMLSAPSIRAAYKSFENDFSVYVFDRRKNIGEGYTVYDMAEDTASVMRSLGVSDAYFFGASQGGMMAQIIALNHPGLVKKLVLGSTTSKTDDNASSVLSDWIKKAEQKDRKGFTQSTMSAMYSKRTYDMYIDAFMEMSSDITDEEFERFIIMAKASSGFDVYDKLNGIKAGVFVIGSFGDKVLGAEASFGIAEKLGCELFMYGKEYGHCVYDEAPDYKEKIMSFFGE